jgi:preprotein translocase subunit SecG
MVTIGVLATLALLIVGLVLLQSRLGPSPDAHASAQAKRVRKAA